MMKKSPQIKPDVLVFEGPESALERMLIDEYLKQQGISSVKELCKLPEEKAKQLRMEACRYASLKLAEIESTDRFQKDIHTHV
jgi:ABC-type histidine transport system ATPase subunit